jgi:hypothetical protein
MFTIFYQDQGASLLLASQKGLVEIASILIDRGANIEAQEQVSCFPSLYYLHMIFCMFSQTSSYSTIGNVKVKNLKIMTNMSP